MTLILVAGFMLYADLWSDMEQSLERFGPVIHADPRNAASIEDMAAEVLAQAPDRFALIGFSMGGYVARAIQRMAPERVTKLALIATSARGDSTIQARRIAALSDANPEAFRGLSKQSIRQSLAPEREDDAALITRIQAMSLRLGGHVFHRQARFRRAGDLAQLAAITCPTLIVAGSKDRLRSVEESVEMQQAIAQARLEIIDSGHMIPMEQPAALAAMIEDFLS